MLVVPGYGPRKNNCPIKYFEKKLHSMTPYWRPIMHFSSSEALREALKKPAEPNISQMDEIIGYLSSIKKKIPHKTPINTIQDMSPPLNILWGKLAWVHDPFNYLLSRAAHKSIIFSPFLLHFPHFLPLSTSLIPFFLLPFLASPSSLQIWNCPFISLFPLLTFPDNTQPFLGPGSWCPTIAATNWLQLIPGAI